jgi:hypothetical protein
MSKYPASTPGNNPALNEPSSGKDLELPVDRDFWSRPPRIEPRIMLQRIAETLPWRSTRPGEADRRLAEKVDVEFIL